MSQLNCESAQYPNRIRRTLTNVSFNPTILSGELPGFLLIGSGELEHAQQRRLNTMFDNS